MAHSSPVYEIVGPATLAIAGRAFDEAWLEISGSYQSPEDVHNARERLARIILAQPLHDKTDVGALKQAAIAGMAVGEPMPS
jgi:hypothetical protein